MALYMKPQPPPLGLYGADGFVLFFLGFFSASDAQKGERREVGRDLCRTPALFQHQVPDADCRVVCFCTHAGGLGQAVLGK